MNHYIYALGFFDGVHIGHQALLKAVRDLCFGDTRPGVITFAAHPDTLVTGQTPKLINTPQDRVKLLKRYGMERVVTLPFDKKMCATSWQDFLAGQYIIRYTAVLSNRFDTTAFKKVMPEIYNAYTKQVSSRRFTISM